MILRLSVHLSPGLHQRLERCDTGGSCVPPLHMRMQHHGWWAETIPSEYSDRQLNFSLDLTGMVVLKAQFRPTS